MQQVSIVGQRHVHRQHTPDFKEPRLLPSRPVRSELGLQILRAGDEGESGRINGGLIAVPKWRLASLPTVGKAEIKR